MPDRGQVSGLDFRFQQFPSSQPAAPQQQQPVDVQVPGYEQDPIAVREKLTSDYYNNAGLLRSFAQDMAKKGVNVFEPDYSQDGGGLAFQTAQKLQAGLMYAANALKGEFKSQSQMLPSIAEGRTRIASNVDQNGLYASDPNSYVATKVTPGTDELNQRLAQETNDPQSQARANALIKPYLASLQERVSRGELTEEEAQREASAIIPNAWRTQPFAPKSAHGLSEEDFRGRDELIKKMKSGVITRDPSVLNTLKLVPGVEDVEYVNTGDKVGIQVYMKGQGQPAFIDAASGEGEINAMLNRIEGQKNIPNEAVPTFDTKVQIPESNASQVIKDVKDKVKTFDPEAVGKLQELAASGELSTPNGEPIASIEIDGPVMGLFGKTELKVTYYPVSNNRVNYSRKATKYISDPAELDSFIESNSNQVAPAFGGGFVDPNVSNEAQRAQELINKYRRK